MGMFDGSVKTVFFMSNPEWYDIDDDYMPHLTDKAPPEAVESFNYWKARFEEEQRTGVVID